MVGLDKVADRASEWIFKQLIWIEHRHNNNNNNKLNSIHKQIKWREYLWRLWKFYQTKSVNRLDEFFILDSMNWLGFGTADDLFWKCLTNERILSLLKIELGLFFFFGNKKE